MIDFSFDPAMILCAGFPVIALDGLVRIGQNVLSLLSQFKGHLARYIIISLIIHGVVGMMKFLSKPFYIVGIVFLLTYFPDVIQWIFMQLGLIEVKIFALLLSIVMPQIFGGDVGAQVNDWSQIWNAALNALPPDVLDVLAKANVAELLGIVTSCLTSGWVIKIYRHIMLRAGLL